jgi:1-acyl-sn-glycerol-3-phosphate acyltransferase
VTARTARRTVTLPVAALAEVTLLLLCPLALLVAGIVSLLVRTSRPVRSVLAVAAYIRLEFRALVRFLRSPADADAWQGLARWFLGELYDIVRRSTGTEVVLEAGSARPEDLDEATPLVVLARHCGPGDSFLLAWLLVVHYRRRLGAVVKAAMRAEPAIDLAGDHLPIAFIGRRGTAAQRRIAQVAAGLGPGDALLLFPEGGNYSTRRWRLGVLRLLRSGRFAAARGALRRRFTLPPHPGGVRAALQSATTADVLLVTHAGFADSRGTNRSWWRLPSAGPFVARCLRVPADQVPRDDAGIEAWLEEAWSRVDTWVAARSELRAAGIRPGVVSDAGLDRPTPPR